MAIPFLNFLAGGLQGYNTGRQQATVNDQQQQQLTEQQRQAQMMEQYRQQALAEQIRSAIAGEGLQQQQVGNQNTQFYAGQTQQNQQFNASLGQRANEFDKTFGLSERQFGLNEQDVRARIGQNGLSTLFPYIGALDKMNLPPEQRAALLNTIGVQAQAPVPFGQFLPQSVGQQNDQRLQEVGINNAKIHGGYEGALAQNLRQDYNFGPQNLAIKQGQLANQQLQTKYQHEEALKTIAVNQSAIKAQIANRDEATLTALSRAFNTAQQDYSKFNIEQIKAEQSRLESSINNTQKRIDGYQADRAKQQMVAASYGPDSPTENKALAGIAQAEINRLDAQIEQQKKWLATGDLKKQALTKKWGDAVAGTLPTPHLKQQLLDRMNKAKPK